MVDWRVYYDDGSTFDSDDGSAYQAPALGVQVIATVPDLWHGGDIFGLWDYLAHRIAPQRVLFGRLIDNETYAAIEQRAAHDPDLPQGRHLHFNKDYYWWNG